MRRPYTQSGIGELRALFDAATRDLDVLELLRFELSHRSTKAARELQAAVLERLAQLLDGSDALLGEDDAENAEEDVYPVNGETRGLAASHPDDQKKPEPSRMRPPGTRGLPEVWQRQLNQDFSLPDPADADFPECFIAALNALIAEIKRSGSGQKRYEIERGQRLESENNDTLYAFAFSDEADLFEDAQVEVQLAGRKVQGSIVSISSGRLVLAISDDVGPEIERAVFLVDTTALLAALVAKIEQVSKGEITLNRDLADQVAGAKVDAAVPPPFSTILPKDLDHAKRRAVEKASTSAITWIWGPPGCGKTTTIGAIVRASFEAGHRLLICSNTNKAVDQVILSVCKTLGKDHPAMESGQVLRMGRIADNKLQDYADYVTVDGIVTRRTTELTAHRGELERNIELIDRRSESVRRTLARFSELDRLSTELASARKVLAEDASQAEAAAREHQSGLKRKAELDSELVKRRSAFLTLLRRSEEDILKDLATQENKNRSLEASVASTQGRHLHAKRALDAAGAAHEAMRTALAGQDRSLLVNAVKEAGDSRADLTQELREVDAKIASVRDLIVKEARVLGTTCTKAYLAIKDIGQVDTVIIDEASMVLLPVAWFVSGIARQRVIISGDFRQIPPIVQSNQQSIVEVVGVDPFGANGNDANPDLVMLDTQFRMDDAICKLIAGPMYTGKLQTAPGRESDLRGVAPPFNQPLTIIDTSDLWPFESQNAFLSRFNLMHALLARNLAHHFDMTGSLTSKTCLGICTPYAAQAKIVQKLIAGDRANNLVLVGTVHSYQGDERDTMLIDIPESHGGAWALGQFVQGLAPDHVGARLINVAVSRAKYRLIVLANLTYLDAKLPSSSLLRSILYDMQEKGTVIKGSDVLALRPIDRDLSGLIGQIQFDEISQTLGIFDEAMFERGLERDINDAKRSIVIFSGYVTPARVGKLGDLLRAKIGEGVAVRCVTRPPQTNGSIPRDQGKAALDMLEGIGVVVDCRAKIHQKVCLIDGRIVWLGSLNALSHAGLSDETMTRAVNEAWASSIAGHMSKRRVSVEKAAATVTLAENPRCPSCSSRSIYYEGRYGPYFVCESECGWRLNEKVMSNGVADTNLPIDGPECPKCASKTKLRSGRNGPFYGCRKYPSCDGTVRP